MDLHWRWPPRDAGALTIATIDAHAAGEPLRIIVDGMPPLEGATSLERRRDMRERFDHIRQALMWEPRGHYNMYGCVLTPPVTPEADLGVIFPHK
jgi:trans-L-3-hydroxyproline dehydratase